MSTRLDDAGDTNTPRLGSDFYPHGKPGPGGTTGGAGGTCPSIEGQPFATGLKAGEYFLRVTTTELNALFNYRLQITITE